MTTKTLEIHSENILPIIKKWLYSDKDIFVRELVANACDALHKVKILRDQGKLEANDEEFRIDIQIDKEAKTLTFSDTGLGMDAEEIEKYIARVAFSSAEEFVEKYQSNEEKDQIIGHFGLGFYSAYMAAETVNIDSHSYKEGAKPAFWSCDGSSEYEMSEGKRQERGTTITLHVGEEGAEFLEEGRILEILRLYCSFLPYPIYLGDTQINPKEPLWIKSPSECTDDDYREFYRHLYPMEEEPLFWIHLNVDYPFHLKGLLYFPKIRNNFEIDKNSVKLYCNRVFVSDNCKDVLPDYLTALRGVIDSPDIPLNVSRSTLQMDRTVRQLGSHISKKVADSLLSLHKSDEERFLNCWQDISNIVKLGVLQDDKFYERVKEILLWKTTDNRWTNVEQYLEQNKEKTDNKLIYSIDEHHIGPMVKMWTERGIEVLLTPNPIDQYVIQRLEQKLIPAKFQRVDGAVDELLVDKEREKSLLDADGKTESSKLASFIEDQFTDEQLTVEAKSLTSDNVLGMIVFDESERRMRDYMRQMSPEAGNLPQKKTFVVNTNNPLIANLQKLQTQDANLAKDLVHDVYEMSLLSQKEMDPKLLSQYLERHQRVLEKLTEKVLEA